MKRLLLTILAVTTGLAANAGRLTAPKLEWAIPGEGECDVFLKWGDWQDGDEDARFAVEHAKGCTDRAFNQKSNPGWHFAGTYLLNAESRLLATNRSARKGTEKRIPAPKGVDEVKVVPRAKRVFRRRAANLVQVVELNVGDRLLFTGRDGRVREIELAGVSGKTGPRRGAAFHSYSFTQEYLIDGRRHSFTYEVPEEDFINAKPFTVDGVDLWPDGIADHFVPEGGALNEKDMPGVAAVCQPLRRARLLVKDAADRIIPEPTVWWYPCRGWPLERALLYQGCDSFMGPWYEYAWNDSPRGMEAHSGLDVDMDRSTPLTVPFDLDDQNYFHSTARGDNNNRWRGRRRWPNGDRWWLVTNHIDHRLLPDGGPLKRGTVYALSGGQWCGHFCHTHFSFHVFTEEEDGAGFAWKEGHVSNASVLMRQMQLDHPVSPRDRTMKDPSVAYPEMKEVALSAVGEKSRTEAWSRANFTLYRVSPSDPGTDHVLRLAFPGRISYSLDGIFVVGSMTGANGEALHFAARTYNWSAPKVRASGENAVELPIRCSDGLPLLLKTAYSTRSREEAKLRLASVEDWSVERFVDGSSDPLVGAVTAGSQHVVYEAGGPDTVGAITLDCGKPDAWKFSVSRRPVEPGVEEMTVKLTAPVPLPPPHFTLSFEEKCKVGLKSGVKEVKLPPDNRIAFFSEPVAPLSDYTVKLRIDRHGVR